MHKRDATDAEFIESLADWLVSSQRVTRSDVNQMSWSDILIHSEREFPGGLRQAMDHFAPMVLVA